MDPERRRRLVALGDLQREWADKHQGAAAAAFDPSGRPAGSDYNQHHVDVDAPAAAEDEFHTKARKIMGIDS
ncbi:hypothetical protein AB0M91_09310 [Micromonospora rifamycinica]|uniref:hypothetical protein n=1 Tax=Micromonospora rifamycinica TaxID=291594 RepID=UPI0034211C2D